MTNNAENVKPQIEASREDSTEAISRMEDGNTAVGGPLVSAEVNSRSEGVLPRIRGWRTSRHGQGRNAGACRRVGNVPEMRGADFIYFESI